MPRTPAATLSTSAAKASLAKLESLSSEQLARRMVERRAVEAVIWGMAAVNFDLMYQAMVREVKGGWNQIVYWSGLPDWKNQTLTPNPDSIYLMPFFNLKDGPVVIAIPPADGGTIVGSIMDSWQGALEDVGPAGVDKGKGGKYLILPPGYTDKTPDGYIPLQSDTTLGYALLRSILKSGSEADLASAIAYGKRIAVYPLAQAANPPATVFADALGVVFDATIPYDIRFFESLDRFVQSEPWLTRDKAMIDPLKTIGIVKGKPFDPDPATREILEEAAREAHAWLDAKYERIFDTPFDAGARWTLPASPELLEGLQTFFTKPDTYPIDDRGVTYSMAFFSPKHMSTGSYYLMTIRDKAGDALDGAKNYRLTVPANPPVNLYWSATAYDRDTHALIRNQPHASRASTSPGLQTNAVGSVDAYFGPKPPAGKETNWVPTDAGGKFEVLFRFYGPQKPLFDKTWKLPDIEKVN
jgi:hypothetical protein